MSTFPFHLPARHAPVIQPARLPALNQRIEIWMVTGLLLSSVGIVCLNLPWATGMWQLLLFAFAVVVAFQMDHAVHKRALLPLIAACAIPMWGALQLLLHSTAYRYATLAATLQWATFPACMLLGLALFHTRSCRDAFLRSLWAVAIVVTGVELYQLFVLGRYTTTSTGLPLMSSNFYAEFVELLLPVVLAMALRKGEAFWLGCGLTSLMVGTTVASGARMGSALLLLEIVAVLWRTRVTSGYLKLSWKRHGAPLLGMLLFAVVLEGATNLAGRLHEPNPFADRSQVVSSALQMIKAHPVAGFGLGAFSIVYPQYSHFETSYYINHVHNDPVELMANGGLIGIMLWLLVLATTLPAAAKAPWAIGVFAFLIHGMSDFPLYRLSIAALLATLMAAAKDRDVQEQLINTPGAKRGYRNRKEAKITL